MQHTELLFFVMFLVLALAGRQVFRLSKKEVKSRIPDLLIAGLSVEQIELKLIQEGADPDDVVMMVEKEVKKLAKKKPPPYSRA